MTREGVQGEASQREGIALSPGTLYNTGVPGDRERVAMTATIVADSTNAVRQRMVRYLSQ